MKWMVKLVLIFLIAWLPIEGFSAPALLCPHESSPVSTSHLVEPHGAALMTDMHMVAPGTSQHRQPACQSGAHSLSCTILAILAATSVPAVATTSSRYPLRDTPQISQFVPDLPQRPPQAL